MWYLLTADTMSIDFRYWGFLFMFSDYLDGMIIHAAVGCVISIAVTLLSVLIYKKRDARSVGTPISSKLFFEIMMAGACATIFSLSFMSSEVMWGVLTAAVAYIIINIIVSRAKINALSFAKWIGKFAVTLTAFTVLTVISIKTGGFGYYKVRPDAVYFEGAKFNIGCVPRGSVYFGESSSYETKPLTVEEADEVVKIWQKHLQKGIAEVNPFNVIFDNYDTPWVTVYATGSILFGDNRSPKFMFVNRYYDDGYGGYALNYHQTLHVSYTEMKALAEELRQLDYMSKINFNTNSTNPQTQQVT